MERKLLLEAAESVAPALSATDIMPIMQCLWFSGDSVMAYNDVIALRAPLRTDFSGAVSGKTLLALLRASRAKDVETIAAGDALKIKAAGARMTLPVQPVDHFVFEFPKLETVPPLPIDNTAFLQALAACMQSIGDDTGHPDTLGVTLIAGKDSITLYSTNNRTMTRAVLPVNKGAKLHKLAARSVLPALFCAQLLKLARKGINLQIDDIEAHLTAPDASMYGKLVQVDKPLDFDGIFGHHVPGDYRKRLREIPKRLALALERATIVAGEDSKTLLSVKEGKLRLVTTTDGKGEIRDVLAFPDHEDAEFSVKPKVLRAAIDGQEKMLITKQCAVLEHGSILHLVAGQG